MPNASPHNTKPRLSPTRLAIVAVIGIIAIADPAHANPEALAEYRQRLRQIPNNDLDGRVNLGRWCEQQGLSREADVLYRLVLRSDPNHRQAYDQLLALVQRAKLPAESPHRMDALARKFPDGFYLAQTDHYLIVYDTSHFWADLRTKMLQQVHEQFYQQMRRAGFRPMPLERRLVCVLFNDHADYTNHALQNDGKQITWADGYFSVRHNQAVFYNSHTGPDQNAHRNRMDQLQNKIDGLRLRAKDAADRQDQQTARRLKSQLARAEREIKHSRRHYLRQTGLSNIATAIHEAAHQLAFNSGIQKRGLSYPFWFTEGLAMAFETTNTSISYGPLHANRHRRDRFLKAQAAGHLIPLTKLIKTRSLANDAKSDRVEITYAQAWALWHFLFKERREQLREFTHKLNTQFPVVQDEQKFEQMFIETFGAINAVDRQMRAYYRK